MKQLHFQININAPKEKVWETIIGKTTYPLWTEPFSPDSTVQGSWEKGSKIRFVGLNEYGKEAGMLSEIAEYTRYEFLSIRHIGIINNGVEDTTSEMVKAWTPSYENYTLRENDGNTEFTVDLQIPEDMVEEFTAMWEKGLVKLKEVAETGTSKTIAIVAYVKAPIAEVWEKYTNPEHVTKWSFASDDWESPYATSDLRVGGRFVTGMASKDGKNKFDFTGVYTRVEPQKALEYTLDDGRKVETKFAQYAQSVQVIVTFEMEHENSRELQRNGWQAILNNFKKYTEQSK